MSDAYNNLAGKLGFAGSERLMAVLKHLMTTEQAEIADALPGSFSEVSEKTGINEETVKNNLEEMFKKGVVFPKGDFKNREYYRFAREIIQLHDATQADGNIVPAKEKKFFQLWHDFCRNEMYNFLAAFAENIPQPLARIVPAYKSVKDLTDVHPWENFKEILKAQDLIAVVPCSCRYRTTGVEEHCSFTKESDDWRCLQFGRGAEYVITRGSGRRITLEEALEIAERAEEDGLVHTGSSDNSMHFTTSCQCCSDCCEIFVATNENDGDIGKVYGKSRFEALISEEDCSGCELCIDYCQFKAIEMGETAATVDPEECFGCGICVVKCSTGAAYMRPRPE